MIYPKLLLSRILGRKIRDPYTLQVELKHAIESISKTGNSDYFEIVKGEWDSTIFKPVDNYAKLKNYYVVMPYDGIDHLSSMDTFKILLTRHSWEYNF